MSELDYEGDGLKQLASMVLLQAIEDYREDLRKGRKALVRQRGGNCVSAEAFLKGKTPGPGGNGMSMLELCCQLAEINIETIWERVLR